MDGIRAGVVLPRAVLVISHPEIGNLGSQHISAAHAVLEVGFGQSRNLVAKQHDRGVNAAFACAVEPDD